MFQVLRLPSFLAYPLFYKLLDSQEDKAVPTEKLKAWLDRHSALTQVRCSPPGRPALWHFPLQHTRSCLSIATPGASCKSMTLVDRFVHCAKERCDATL